MEEEDKVNEENKDQSQFQTEVGVGGFLPTEDVDTSSLADGLSEAAGKIVEGIIEGVGPIISNITD
jgi:hypothetical protein